MAASSNRAPVGDDAPRDGGEVDARRVEAVDGGGDGRDLRGCESIDGRAGGGRVRGTVLGRLPPGLKLHLLGSF